MEVFRVIQTPQHGRITIALPAHLKNRAKLEVIILTVDETEVKPFDPKQFKAHVGCISGSVIHLKRVMVHDALAYAPYACLKITINS